MPGAGLTAGVSRVVLDSPAGRERPAPAVGPGGGAAAAPAPGSSPEPTVPVTHRGTETAQAATDSEGPAY
jgi:hypothetical protein